MNFDFSEIKKLSGPILITGHTGFKGAWMLEVLRYYKLNVIGFSQSPTNDSLYQSANMHGLQVEVFGDIRDYKSIASFIERNRPSAVIHLAAESLVLNSYEDPLKTFETNVMGTANLLEVCRISEFVKAVLVITTDKVYKNEGLNEVFDEMSSLEGKDPYSSSKVGTEAVVKAWQQLSSIGSGPAIGAARAGNVIGGGDLSENRLIPDLIKAHISKTNLQVRNPNSDRPWQHVLDPLFGYLLYLENLLKFGGPPCLNFGPNHPNLTVIQVAELMSKNLATEVPILVLTDESKKESDNLSIDASLAESTLNWRSRWNQRDSVLLTANWWVNVLSNDKTPSQAIREDILHYLQETKRN